MAKFKMEGFLSLGMGLSIDEALSSLRRWLHLASRLHSPGQPKFSSDHPQTLPGVRKPRLWRIETLSGFGILVGAGADRRGLAGARAVHVGSSFLCTRPATLTVLPNPTPGILESLEG